MSDVNYRKIAEDRLQEISELWKELNAQRAKGMGFDEYQELAGVTDGQASAELKDRLNVGCLGLAGEAGEVLELIKKFLYHGHGLDDAKFTKELGDVQWYIARLAKARDIKLSAVAHANIEKLRARYGEKFSTHASLNRKEE